MHRFRRSISTVGLGAITAMTVIGAIVVLPAAAGAATLRPVVNGAGVSSLLGGGTASVSQDYYDTALTGTKATFDFTFTVPTITCTKAEDKAGAANVVASYLTGTPKTTTGFPGETVGVFESCPISGSGPTKPSYSAEINIDNEVTPNFVAIKPGSTATVVMTATPSEQTVTMTDAASKLDLTGTLAVGLTPLAIQTGYQVSNAPFPTFTTVTYSAMSVNKKPFGSLHPTATQDISGTTLSPITGGTSFTVTDNAA
jgi:hypothetical protein